MFVDSSPFEAYANLHIDRELTEGHDYMLIPEAGYEFLRERYGEVESTVVKRYSIWLDEEQT
jgi:hypothetical protein